MCGVPIHRADEYLQRLIRRGFRVAVCEQMEDPAEARKRGSKAVVRRDVVRLVTPGTLTEDSLLDAKARNYLTARVQGGRKGGRQAADRARLPRPLDRRVRGRRGAGRRFPRRDRAPVPGRGGRRRRPAGRCRHRQMDGDRGCLRDPRRCRLVRQHGRRTPPQGAAEGGRSRRLRCLLAGGAGGRRRAPQVRRADSARQAALPACATADRAVQPAGDRRADAREPGAAALAVRRAPVEPARRHRSHGDGARRAGAGCAAGEPAARSRRDRSPARRGRLPARQRAAARGRARLATDRARHRARHVAPRLAARRPARPCRRARRLARGGRVRSAAADGWGRDRPAGRARTHHGQARGVRRRPCRDAGARADGRAARCCAATAGS